MHEMSAPQLPFQTRALSETFAVEITGLDVAKPLSETVFQALYRTWEQAGVAVLRDQHLSEAELVEFSRRFGELDIIPETDKHSNQHPEILKVTNVDAAGQIMPVDSEYREYFRILTGAWHTDGSYRPVPALATLLNALEVPPMGGETAYADCRGAYRALPAELADLVHDKHMVHYYGHTRVVAPGLPPLTAQDLAPYPPITHPVVRTLNDGSKSLYVSANVAYYLGGMPLEEGRQLHKRLMEWITQPRFVYKHQWRVGDLVIWDNRRLLHSAQPFDETKHRRVMQRTEVKGQEAPH